MSGSAMSGRAAEASRALAGLARPRAGEVALWAAAALAWVFLPDQSLILNQVAIVALFAVSLDLILGYAGIISLGQAAFLGFGCYAAGLLTKYGVTEPVLGLVVSGAATGLLGLATSPLVLRGTDLTRIMVTISVSVILLEAANRMAWLTGGADGLQGVAPGPVLGLFEFDIFGRVPAAYSLLVLFAVTMVLRRLVHSAFGLSLRAVKGNALRTSAIGVPVTGRLVAAYTVSAACAGLAGALLAQTTQFVSLDVLEFHRSAHALLILTIGGAGYLYGGIVGAVLFTLIQDWLAARTPEFWEFWVGLILVILVLVGRERINALPGRAMGLLRPGRAA